jgi:hypothetical protein
MGPYNPAAATRAARRVVALWRHDMTKTMAVALALLLGNAGIAAAQELSEIEMEKIVATLSHVGYSAPSNIRRDGDAFLLTAVKNATPQNLWVDPQSGLIKPLR